MVLWVLKNSCKKYYQKNFMEEQKTMKKKLLSAVLSMVLCLGMSTAVYASPSTSVPTPDAYVTVNGQQVEISISAEFTFNTAQADTVEKTLLRFPIQQVLIYLQVFRLLLKQQVFLPAIRL